MAPPLAPTGRVVPRPRLNALANPSASPILWATEREDDIVDHRVALAFIALYSAGAALVMLGVACAEWLPGEAPRPAR